MTVGDVNNDQSPDLVIGAPFAPAGGVQNGFVTALYSSKENTGNKFFTVKDWLVLCLFAQHCA